MGSACSIAMWFWHKAPLTPSRSSACLRSWVQAPFSLSPFPFFFLPFFVLLFSHPFSPFSNKAPPAERQQDSAAAPEARQVRHQDTAHNERVGKVGDH